jgi:hypothetical protein
MPVDAALLAAYRRTEYRVDDAGYAFVLRIDVPSEELRRCHDAFGVTCSTFITAWNPRSLPTPQAQNDSAMARLEQVLTAMGCRWLRGEGVDPDGDWPGEPSLLVLGLDEPAAVTLARRFNQNAFVWTGLDATPRLVNLMPDA